MPNTRAQENPETTHMQVYWEREHSHNQVALNLSTRMVARFQIIGQLALFEEIDLKAE